MVDKAKEAVAREGINGFFWGHAGDGNLHLGLMYHPADDQHDYNDHRSNLNNNFYMFLIKLQFRIDA